MNRFYRPGIIRWSSGSCGHQSGDRQCGGAVGVNRYRATGLVSTSRRTRSSEWEDGEAW